MSSTRSSAHRDELSASETLIAISMSPNKKDATKEARAGVEPFMRPNIRNNEVLPSSRRPASASRALFSPHIKGAPASSIVTPKSTIKSTTRVSRHRSSSSARAVPGSAAARIAAVENSATNHQLVKPEADDIHAVQGAMETPITHRDGKAKNNDSTTTAINPSTTSASATTRQRDITSPSTVALPLLSIRSAYNDDAHGRMNQSAGLSPAAPSLSSTAAPNNTTTTHIYNGVASYVEQAAEDDIKTKLLMEINDLKQLLSGRKAQVNSLTAANTTLKEKLQRLQGMERQSKRQKLSSRSPTPTRFIGEETQVKVAKGMSIEVLREEAMVRGMDAATVTPLNKEALLENLVIGTTCITKSTAWAEFNSLRAEIDNEKVAIRIQEEDEKLRLLELEKKRQAKREKRALQQQRNKELAAASASSSTAFTRGGMEALESATKSVCKSELQKGDGDGAAATTTTTTTATTSSGKRRGRPRKASAKNKKPSFGKRGSAFGTVTSKPAKPPTVTSGIVYPSLAAEEDEKNTHPSHAIIRRDILEAFVTVAPKEDEDLSGEGKKKTARRRRYAGKVGFRCRFCKDKHVEEQGDLSVIYPESLKGLYRANIRFQSKHIQACQYIPQELRDELEYLKTCKEGMNRGNKSYWVESALRKGFRDWQAEDGSRKGIIYCPELNEELKSSSSSGTH